MYCLVASFFLSSFNNAPNDIKTNGLPEETLVWPVVSWLTSMLLYQLASTRSYGDFIVDSFENEKDNNSEKYSDWRQAARQ